MTLSFQPGSVGSEVGVCDSSSPEASGAVEVVRPPVSGPWDYALLSGISSSVKRVPSLLPENEDELPPLLITTGEDEAGGVCLFAWIQRFHSSFQTRTSLRKRVGSFTCCSYILISVQFAFT